MRLASGSATVFGLCMMMVPTLTAQQLSNAANPQNPHQAASSSIVTTSGGTTGRVPVFTGSATLGNSFIFQNSTGVGIGAAPAAPFDVTGRSVFHGIAALFPGKAATASAGANSFPLELDASAYNSSTHAVVTPVFQLINEPVGNNSAKPGSALHVLYGTSSATAAETGLSFNSNGTINFSSAQKFPIAAGPAGPAGPQGPAGPAGPTGPAGPSGTLTLPYSGSGTTSTAGGQPLFSITNLTNDGTGIQGIGGPGSDYNDPVGGAGVIGTGGDGQTAGTGLIGKGGTGETQGYGVIGIAGPNEFGAGGFFEANGNTYAGQFDGDVDIQGNLSKSSGSFKIDDPLDPSNKYLYHSFVESPDMKNIYDGNVTTDGRGDAVVTMPQYFEALNRDFRYQLTVIGQFAQAIVASKISNGSFVIKTDKPNVEVSWQVTGIRQDAWANAHRIPNEVDKPEKDKGRFLHPELFGKTSDARIMPHGLSAPRPKTRQ